MRIGITGASGFIGKHLARQARNEGHEVVGFSRTRKPLPNCAGARLFDPDSAPDLTGLDAVVHLAGESILGLWTPAKKRRILESRVKGTQRIVEALDAGGPDIFICGSATGIYGDTGEREVDETCPPGTGFLAAVATAWEAEAARAVGVRTVFLRTGFVLGADGGAMALVRPVFKSGLGGPLGSGRQWMSCIHVDDVAGLILHAITNPDVSGPLNAVLPSPVRNSKFTRSVARAVHRPAFLPASAFALKMVLGEFSHLLLDSQRVVPAAALAAGYAFRNPDLDSAVAASVA